MANLPILQSKEQILGSLITGFLARVKAVNDVTRASIINQFFSAIAQSNFKAAADVISMIDALNVDRATGEALQRLARDANIITSPGTFSSGKVNITDLSFVKVSSNVFAGQPAPVAGSTKIYIVNGSKWNQTGKVYLGRNTPNVEGPLDFISVQQEANGAYWSINLNPGTPTTKFHNIGEEAVQAKGGNRVLNSGTIVRTPPGSAVTSVDFGTVSTVIIPDGEVTYTEIPVVSRVLGTKGNVPRGAISEAVGLPFVASVFNTNAIVNGLAPDDDDSLRKKIKEAELKKSKGTEKAIELSAIGVTSDDDQAQVVSSKVVRYADSSAALIFDDGSGYEAIFDGVGLEQVIDQAVGGEPEVQLRKRPVTPALVKSITEGPYQIPDNWALEVTINDITKTHFFSFSDFKVPANQRPFEIVSSINGDPNIHFLASTADGGTRIVIYPKDRNSNDIKVERRGSNDANDHLNFPITIQYALLLYKNDEILYQDGKFATVQSRLKSTWSTSISPGDTLSFTVDGTPEITIQFTIDDFQQVDISSTVNSFTDIAIWVEVMNRLMTGIKVSENGENVDFTSARGEDDRASIEITGGTLKDKIFSPGDAQTSFGRTSDYTLNKQTGQVGLVESLLPGDKISAGSQFTHAKVVTTQIPDGPTAAGELFFIVDGDCTKIESELQANTVTSITKGLALITISSETPGGDPVAFDKVLPGDWLLIWTQTTDSVNYPSMDSAKGFWRVETVKRGEITVNDGTTPRTISGVPEVLPTDRMVFVRSFAPIQKLSFNLGTLSGFIDQINDQLIGVTAEVVGSTVRIATETAGQNGQLLIVAANSQGKALGLLNGVIYNNIPSHRAFTVTEDSEAGMPSFSFAAIEGKNSDTEYISSLYEKIGGTSDDFIELLPKYEIQAEDLVNLPDTNQLRRIFVKDFNSSLNAVTVLPKSFMEDDSSPLQLFDRYFLRTSYQFDADDTVTAVIDGDSVTKGFGLRVARQVIVNSHSTPTLADFSADDGESSLLINDPSSFNGFDFRDFKVWRKASQILTNGSYALRAQSGLFGPAGNKTRIGFVYPKSLSQVTPGVDLLNSETIDIGIIIPISTPRTPNWDGTTSFTVDVTSIGPGKDSAKFTWRTGTEPNFLAGGGGANVTVGDIVMINPAIDFLTENKDIQAKITNVNLTDFTIELPSGKVVSDNIEFNSIENENKVVTVITDTPHNILQGDRVGIWNTELVDGVNAPLDGSYYPIVTSPTTFTYTSNNFTPGKAFTSPGATHSANLITVNAIAHGLSAGNVILISDAGTGYDGKVVVRDVVNLNKFTAIRAGASVGISSGRFDYQSFGPDYDKGITSLQKISDTVTATVAVGHGLSVNDIVEIFGTDIDDWGGVNEIQTITNTLLPQVGDFQIEYNGANITSALPYTANSLQVQTAINALSLFSTVQVTGSLAGGGFVINYIGADGNLNQIQPTIINNTLTGNGINEIQAVSFGPTGAFSTWSAATTYVIGSIVTLNGVTYISEQVGNLNNNPETALAFWNVYVALAGYGQYRLEWNAAITAFIPYNATAAVVQTALEALAGIGAGQVLVTGSYTSFFRVEFTGTLSKTNVNQITINTQEVYTNEITEFSAITVPTYSLLVPYQTGDVVIYNPGGGNRYYVATQNTVGHLPSNATYWKPDVIPVYSGDYAVISVSDKVIIASGPNTGTVYTVVNKSATVNKLSVLELDSTYLYSAANVFTVRQDIELRSGTQRTGVVAASVVLTVATVRAGGPSASYSIGDIVEYGGLLYKSLSNSNATQPDITPSDWATTTEDLSGRFIVTAISSTTFSYILDDITGSAHSSECSFTKLKQFGKLARSIASSALLQFGAVSTTTQQIVDTLTQDFSDLITVSVELPDDGTNVVNTSTTDLDIASSYISADAYSIDAKMGSRLIKVKVNVNIPAGASITLSSANHLQYNGTYTALAQEQVGPDWKITIQSPVFAKEDDVLTLSTGVIIGSSPYRILFDGENSVFDTDLDALIGTPTFEVKRPWVIAPYIGEELRLLTTNTDQLTRFWNRLVVTGLSNVTKIENSEYGRQLQLTTNTFGANGSIQVVGGIANSKQVAIIGAGSEQSNVGILTIPLELRTGINERQWLRVEQTVRGNKVINLASGTFIQTNANGIQIISGSGSFQTERAITSDETSIFKVERHGKFVAIIGIGGQELGLSDGDVKEGDWVRIKNTTESAYDNSVNYAINDRVLSQGLNFTARAINGIGTTIVNPIPTTIWGIGTEYDIDDTVSFNNKAYRSTANTNIGQLPNDPASDWELTWEIREWSGGNTGIYRVVRTFGDNAFWIENENAIEELLTLGNSGNLSFYSYDSVMPGDTLVVSSGIIGTDNLGRFTVRDEIFDPTFSFPTPTRIWTDLMIANTSTGLGDSYVQLNIEEAEPVRLWKRVFSVGPGASGLATVVVDSPDLINRITSSNAGFIEVQGKLTYDTVPSFGVDAYKHYRGLIEQLNKVIYGDPTDPINFEGIRAAGTDIDIKAAIIRRVILSISIRVRTGIPFSEVRESVKAAAAGYVNNLGTGEQVALSKVVEAVSKVNGVSSVVIAFPTYNSVEDQIAISPQEKALIQDPTNDVTVSILGT